MLPLPCRLVEARGEQPDLPGVAASDDRREIGTRIGEEEIDAEALAPGDLILVRAGEQIPGDGAIESGYSTLDESSVTGEPLPRALGEIEVERALARMAAKNLAAGSVPSFLGGGVYLAAGGSACLDAWTVLHVKHNHASTSNDDPFGDYTTC